MKRNVDAIIPEQIETYHGEYGTEHVTYRAVSVSGIGTLLFVSQMDTRIDGSPIEHTIAMTQEQARRLRHLIDEFLGK